MKAVWIDCDPGFDDWLAWLLLQNQPGLQVAGVSVVAGNAPLEITLANALRIRAWHGWGTPIHAGAARPLAPEPSGPITAQYVLGEQALLTVGQQLPPCPPGRAQADSRDAVTALIQHLNSAAGSGTTLVALGPLTNLALAWQADPQALRRAERVLWMGGSTERGNHTPAAEFNAAADPEAADLLLRSGLPMILFGLNACRQVQLTQAHVQAVRTITTPQALMLADHLDAYQRLRSADGSQPMPLYDPLPALWLREPGLFTLAHVPVDMELAGRYTRGMTVVDLRNRAGRRPNAHVAVQVEGEAAMGLVMQVLQRVLA
jgi:purine nucleosidase